MTKSEHEKIDACNYLEQHKRSMYPINQDLLRTVVTHHLVVEASVQLKVYQKKVEINERFDDVGRIVEEILTSENRVAKTAGSVVRLAIRHGWFMKELLETGILVESKGCEENLRTFNGDGEADPDIYTGHALHRDTTSGDVETAGILHKRNICILQEQLSAWLNLVNTSTAEVMIQEKRLKNNMT